MSACLEGTVTVIAELAPLGVQLWPTLTPAAAPNFTLERVQIERTAYGTAVRWIYQSGAARVFALGERVTVKLPADAPADVVRDVARMAQMGGAS